MSSFNHSLIAITILITAIVVMPATSDGEVEKSRSME